MPSDRRTFLRRAAAFGLMGPVAAAWACGGREGRSAGEAPEGAAPVGDPAPRPVPVSPDGRTVHVVAPTRELPVAYLSRSDMRVYLDSAYRDWAEHRLAAYVSVTTGLWRIPRPEDDPRVPIIPGDALREFEVVDLSLWDPGATPEEGDVRLRLGSVVPVRMEWSCVPLRLPSGMGSAWLSAEPTTVQRRDGPGGEGSDGGGREDFLAVATGTRHGDSACTTGGEPVRILTWACPAQDP